MKTKSTEKPMKVISFWKITFVVAVLLTALFPIFGQAGQTDCKPRDISDFLDAQGSSSSFFAPVSDYVGWTDGNFTTFALIDYAGLANEYLKNRIENPLDLRTKVSGYITECPLSNNKAQITVALFTTRALGFAQCIAKIFQFGFLDAPTIFGAKAQDVDNVGEAAVGLVSLVTSFTISSPGAELPDFLDVINSPTHYAPATLDFESTTFERSDSLYVHEVAHTIGNKWVYSVEEVKVDVDGDDCDD